MKKFIFFLAWLGTFTLSLVGITYVVYPSYLLRFNFSPFMVKMLILNISILYILMSFIKLTSKFQKVKDYEMKTADGKVFVSADSIITLVKETLAVDPDISVNKVETKKSGNKFSIKLFIESSANKNIADKSLFIQENIKKRIKESIGLDIHSVELKIVKLVDRNS